MKLYQEIDEENVLAKVFEMIKETRGQLIVSKQEDENHKIGPNEEYYKILQDLHSKGVKITRYYYGSLVGFLKEQRTNPNIENIYAGKSEEYQRMIISDGKSSMAKIGVQFVYSENKFWIQMLKKCIRNKFIPEV